MGLIRAQSRFFMKTLFKRNYDALTASGQSMVDKIVIAVDIAVVIGLFLLL